jgi:hypothetical protein
MSGQDTPKGTRPPAHQENIAKQAWDDEGGSLHPDETKLPTAELADPVDTRERTADTADDEPDDQPS